MGCQSSKSTSAPQSQAASTSKKAPLTLLDGGEAKKLSDNASAPITQGAEAAVASSGSNLANHAGTEHGESQEALAPPAGDHSTSLVPAHPGSGLADNTSHNESSHGLLRKHRILCTSKKDLDIMVVEFSSHDSTVGSVLGRNYKEMRWKVMYDRDAAPIDIKVHVQEHKLSSNEVEIECNGQHIFHGAGAHAKAKLTEDFRYQWPIRGTIQGINEPSFFEVRPSHFSSVANETWFPATITSQREDGYFEVSAREPDASGFIAEVKYPAVHKDSLRVAASRKPLEVPENCLMLEVPKQDPSHAVLSLANGELVTHHFGKPSPALKATVKPEIALKVSKDRNALTANVGHQVLSHFVSGEVQAKTSEVDRLKHSWTLQVGPFAEHKVEIAKKHTIGKIVTLLVDGEVLVEGTASDLGCGNSEWQCRFRFIGERVLDFEVYKTNVEGGALDETGHVRERRRYMHECCVTIPNDWDFSTARLSIDGTAFTDLPMVAPVYEETALTSSPLVLLHSYGIATPHKVERNAPSNMMLLANKVIATAGDGSKSAGGFFARCCDCGSVADDHVAIKA